MKVFEKHTYEDYYESPMSEFPWTSKLVYGIVVCICGLFTKLVWPWTFEDGHKLWDDKRGRVLIMNHVSILEPICTLVTLWFHRIPVRPIYKKEWDETPGMKWLFSRGGGIPVERGTADIKCLRRAERALKRGECVLIYPEGTRIKSDDQPVEIHGGFALMARMGKAPVQPMAVVGARDIFYGKSRLRPRVYLKVGDCITFDEMTSTTKKGMAEEMEQVAMARVYALRDELRAEHPGRA